MELLGTDIPFEGKVRDIRSSYNSMANVRLDFALQQVHDNQDIQTAVIYDGEIAHRLNNDQLTTELVISSEGSHSLDLVRLPKGSEPINHLQYAFGNTVHLQWDHSTSSDLAYYVIHRGGTEIVRENNTIVDARYHAQTALGGEYSAVGKSETRHNGYLPVTFGSNAFTFDGLTYDFLQAGTSFQLTRGITLTLHDQPGTYSNFDIFLGIKSEASLKNQPSGESTYTITPIDTAGNEGTPITTKVYVHPLPDLWSFDEVSATITQFGANITEYQVYSDYMPANDIWLTYINDAYPVQILIDASPVDLPVGARYYVWPVVNGVVMRNANMYTIPDPAVIVGTLGIPADLVLTPGPGGTLVLEWTYNVLEHDKASHYQIFRLFAGVWTGYTPVVALGQTSAIYGSVLHYKYTLPITYSNGESVTLMIAAGDANNVQGTYSQAVTAIADSLAPTITGDLVGNNL